VLRRVLFGIAALTATLSPLVATAAAGSVEDKVLRLPMRTDGPRSLDPARGSTTYDNMGCAQIFETLLQVSYYDNQSFEPLLLAELPERLDDGKRYRFRLKPGVRFHDNPCFPGGVGREIRSDDVLYSWQRLADPANGLKNWWLLEGMIEGLTTPPEGQAFDYDAPIAGFTRISDSEFEVELKRPVFQFLWVLTMFQTAIVPREAVEHYGDTFGSNPVGTGPYVLESWVPKQKLDLVRNPNYHESYYPEAELWSEEDREAGLADAAGARLPFADRIEFTMIIEEQPLYLEFRQGNLDWFELPYTYFGELFSKRTKRLDRDARRAGYGYRAVPLLDMMFRAFNMEDPLVGGFEPEKVALRRAIAYAVDLREFNDVFYEGLAEIYDGPIPPGLDGHPEGGRVPGAPRGPDLEKARELLAEAGYPGGRGLPPIRYYTNNSSLNARMVELFRRQVGQIGVEIDAQLLDFSQLIEMTNKRQAPMFGFAWLSDYPDGENNLAMFYSKNVSPGSNHWNYVNPEFDDLYERAIVLEPGPERTALYEQMRDIVIRDTPIIGSMARTRYYMWQPWIKNARPTPSFWGWFKYLDIDESAR
jgi:oligopeptide transport system substrate-binding protein